MDHKDYMRRALELAAQAAAEGDVPVGCVIVRDGQIIGEGRNRREENGDATAHAELEAIRDACRRIGSWRLHRCTMYVTLEPCPMCAGGIINSASRRCATACGTRRRGPAARCSTCLRSASTTTPACTGARWRRSAGTSFRNFSWICGKKKAFPKMFNAFVTTPAGFVHKNPVS